MYMVRILVDDIYIYIFHLVVHIVDTTIELFGIILK